MGRPLYFDEKDLIQSKTFKIRSREGWAWVERKDAIVTLEDALSVRRWGAIKFGQSEIKLSGGTPKWRELPLRVKDISHALMQPVGPHRFLMIENQA